MSSDTIQLNISKKLKVRTIINISQPESIGTIYRIEFYKSGDSKVNSIVSEKIEWWGAPEIDFVDLTFDGFLDLRICVERGMPDIYLTYIYDPNSEQYLFCNSCDELYGDIFIDKRKRQMFSTGYWHDAQYNASWRRDYKIKNGFPVMSKYSEDKDKYRNNN
ncbi:MAG: hypothetical protein WDA22_17400 [Bacteroidota bacterium]